MGLSWQPYGLWPLMLVGMPAFTLLLMGLGWRRSFGLGYLFGLTMLTLTVGWVHVLGWWVAGALIVFESLAFGLLGLALSLVTRLRIWPLAAACCWVMVEFTYSRVPFGGFGWVRLAYAAVDTPVAGYLPVIGVAGVGFAVALIAHSIAWVLRSGVKPAGWSRRRRALGCAVLVAVIAVGGLAVGGYEPEPAAGSEGMVNVGVVQGNVPGRGIQALGRARSVTNNHLAETIELMARVRLGQVPPPDFLLWPENSTDIDPHVDPITHSVVSSAVQIAGRPILVGAVTEGPGPDERQTTAMWWDPH